MEDGLYCLLRTSNKQQEDQVCGDQIQDVHIRQMTCGAISVEAGKNQVIGLLHIIWAEIGSAP
jgi:hypothetical protein